VSGGLDSMVMLDIFREAGFIVGVAHCNFQLRGNDSDADERLVKKVCEANGIVCYLQRFETSQIAESEKLSIQVAARKLRYDYFQQLANEYQYQFIATAHHRNDNLETLLINLVRGTGMEGLAGIPVKNGKIIRPLLFATREDLKRYAEQKKLEWREDASNVTDDYQRNFLRHQVVPLLKELNPNLEDTFQDSVERISGTQLLAAESLRNIKEQLFSRQQSGNIQIDEEKLKSYPYPEVILWELLKAEGFHYDQCKLIVQEHQPGRRFTTKTAALIIDRHVYILETEKKEVSQKEVIERGQAQVFSNGQTISLSEMDRTNFVIDKDKSSVAQLDSGKLQFPLIWRTWQPGDYLVPLGMQAKKKVSDLLIDAKVSMPDKQKVTVIESAGQIIWVVGYRIHEEYKVSESTEKIMILEYR
jgi:tRNA(Ile)-lysidine synthase